MCIAGILYIKVVLISILLLSGLCGIAGECIGAHVYVIVDSWNPGACQILRNVLSVSAYRQLRYRAGLSPERANSLRIMTFTDAAMSYRCL